MDRASDSGSEGWGFESLPVYHNRYRNGYKRVRYGFFFIPIFTPKQGDFPNFVTHLL